MKFQAPYVEGSDGKAIHPDDKQFFKRTWREGDLLVGNYTGSLNLTPYVDLPAEYREEITREEFVDQFTFKQWREARKSINADEDSLATFQAMGERSTFDATLPAVASLINGLKADSAVTIASPKLELMKKGVPI